MEQDVEMSSQVSATQVSASNNIVQLTPEEVFNKIKFMYNKDTDTIVLESNNLLVQSNNLLVQTGNLAFKTENTIMLSLKDTVISTGDTIGSNGKLHLNPVSPFESFKNIFKQIVNTL